MIYFELDEIEERTPPPRVPIVLGHQIVGRVEKTGNNATKFKIGDRVGIAWIYSVCGKCWFCLEGNEDLCPHFKATGREINGGYAQYMTVSQDFAFTVPPCFFRFRSCSPSLCRCNWLSVFTIN